MLQTRENFIRSAILESTRDARLAFNSWDHETVLAASKSLLAISAQMAKMKQPEQYNGLDDMGDVLAATEPQDDGNAPVESDVPDPTRPPGGVQVQPNEQDVVAVRNGSGLPVFEEDEADEDPQQPDERPEVIPEPGSQAELIAMLEA